MSDFHVPRDAVNRRRPEPGRRQVDIATHVLEQGVLSAAVMFIELEGDASADDRIAAHRTLRERVRDYLEHSETGAATADALIGLAVVAVALAPKSVLPTGTWLPLLAIVVAAATVVIVAGMRRT